MDRVVEALCEVGEVGMVEVGDAEEDDTSEYIE